ncbi:MAG: SpoIIE family protein phosphatase [Cytophagaceae bacterium]|jgi:serine phosphatase RsbU (regulator of sigma subunit)|nr:SpoIIE family protein phosphatase [Cytophagaceae bacterium]
MEDEGKKRLEENIEVARLIQSALLPEEQLFRSYFSDAFILYLPKDVVSGDFYWMQQYNNKIFVALVDCIGHGVSGAMMSMVGMQILSQVIRDYQYLSTSEILKRLNDQLVSTFEQQGRQQFITCSLDIGLCKIDTYEQLIDFAGAKSNLYCVDAAKKMDIYWGEKYSVGYKIGNSERKFKSHRFYYNAGDVVYLYSDGFPDQLSDEKNNYNKFLHQRLRNLLLENSSLNMEDQRNSLQNAFNEWRGSSEQLDDISILGIRL